MTYYEAMKLHCDVSLQRLVDRHIELYNVVAIPTDNVSWTKTYAAIGKWFVLVEVIKTDNDPGLFKPPDWPEKTRKMRMARREEKLWRINER